ncbi:MAG TPA: 3-deoxy-7-phosphoheptulonate synthase [Thermomicrobiales bacterium]|jgi:3-deoxy-7-phosphoheptulonate synthase|nr:3-deoxy-7-phosphoheptulonate synthase [Thermomicrobiales bacterium]
MIIVLESDVPVGSSVALLDAARAAGRAARSMPDGHGGLVVTVDGNLPDDVLAVPGIRTVERSHKPYPLASAEHRAQTVVTVGDVEIGGGRPVVMAGPCSIEGRDSLLRAAHAVRAAGADILRGGAFKPRTSPYSFQGLGEEGLRYLAEAREQTGMPVITEVMEPEQVDLVCEYADILQIGTRNMSNFPLLRRVGEARKPVLLKRGMSARVDEWLMSAEYVMAGGNHQVILCERGIRGFDPATRFTLDLTVVPLLRQLTHLPIIIDPSHGTGIRSLVGPMALAGVVAGADGIFIEAEPNPERATSDAAQTIDPETLRDIVARTRMLSQAMSAPLVPVVAAVPAPEWELSLAAAD